MRIFASAALMLAAGIGTAGAQASVATPGFAERLAAAERVLTMDGAEPGGPGAATLGEAVDAARYVSIGEAHFSQEIPRFTAALCRRMAPKGLHALAVESGPEATRLVEADLRRPDRVERMAAFMRAHPDAMAFQNGAAESDMTAACAAAAGPGFRVWGLDQEFFGASGFLLEGMAAARPGPVAKAAIDRLQAMDRAATAAAVASGSPAKLLIYTVTDAEMAAAQAAIDKDGGARARAMFAGLAETRAIFLASASGDGDPNGRRARLIKRTLAGYLAAAPADARVLVKFGDIHMTKGINRLRQRDLGNYIAERAEGEGRGSLHILAMGAGGKLGGYNGVGRQVAVRPYDPLSGTAYPWLASALAARPAGARAGDWLLIDLRALREGPEAALPEAWRRVVQGYDLVVIAPTLTPAFLIGAAP